MPRVAVQLPAMGLPAIPAVSACKTCGQTIRWEQRAGKWQAIDPEGESHWATCRPTFPHAAKLMHIAGAAITGKHYQPSCERCDALPWHDCACSFNNRAPVLEAA